MTWSTALLGAGPTPRTVRLPGSIWVRPASAMTSAVMPSERALAMSSCISSALLVCRATLAWPWRSQRCRSLAAGLLGPEARAALEMDLKHARVAWPHCAAILPGDGGELG